MRRDRAASTAERTPAERPLLVVDNDPTIVNVVQRLLPRGYALRSCTEAHAVSRSSPAGPGSTSFSATC